MYYNSILLLSIQLREVELLSTNTVCILSSSFNRCSSLSPGRQKKHPGLTDLAAHSNTPRKRLERRVFSKRAVKKVADAMDVANARSFRDKFGDSFNYALEK